MKKFKKMKKRILSAFMIACMCITILPQGTLRVSAAEEQWVKYNGQTESGTYTISYESQLRMLAETVNSGTDYMDTTFKLTKDIELTEEWIPIGGDTDFVGIFDGDNHTIEGLTITSVDYSDWSDCSLFGEVSDATIQNLTVKVDFNSTNECTGGIVARAYDTKIINCSYEGTIISSNSTVGSAFPGCTGGIAGEVYGSSEIIKCRNKGDIKASDDFDVIAGGIVGYASDGVEIINCKNEGSVNVYAGSDSHVGGIAGRTHMTVAITDCQNTGSISVPDSYAGGIVGCSVVIQASLGGYDYSHFITTIANCLNVNEAQDSLPRGEILGKASRADGTDPITIKNCYYISGSGKPVGSGTADVSVENVENKTTEQFVSGEVAYLLQNPAQVDLSYEPQDGLVWGQNLGDDDFPGLVHFMEGDKAAKEVLKITLRDANATGYTPHETYINNGATIKAAYGFEQISSQGQYPAETYETVGLSGDGTGDIFREDAPITEDNTVLYLFYKEKFSGNNGTITIPPGTEKTQDLDEQMEYAGDTSAAGNFTYEITAGNGDLKAGLSGSTLTIPATAAAGNYTLMIKATEKNPTVKNPQRQEGVTIDSKDSVTFEVSVTVEETNQNWIDEAKKVVQKALDEMNVTNETTKQDVQDVIDQALKEAGLEDVTATVGDDFTIEKETEESEGKITGTVTLEKEGTKSTVEIDKTIEQLPKTDADLAEAKKIVEEVLEGMPVTNDTTKEDIQKAIDAALKEAGLSDVTATVDEFDKTEATKESEGKIQGTVTLEKGKTKGTVNLDKSISNKGIVKKDTHSEDGAPEVDLPMDEKDLADAVLTETDRRAIEDGKNISLLLTVEDATDTVSTADKQKVEEGASYYTVGQYLDINLIKMVDTDNPDEGTPVTKTNAPIGIVITIPEELKKDNRSYAVVRVHEGESVLLEDMDDDPDTVTIETDRFSTYAMVYTEITDADRVTEAQKIVEKVLSDMAVTNDTTKESIQQAVDAALKEAGFSDVTATVGELTKKDATGEAEGSIVGTVTIKKGEKSGSISINKTITKLPQDNTGNQGDDSTVTPPDSTVITPEQQEKNEFALNSGLKVYQVGKKIYVEWGKVKDADGYLVYLRYCGKRFDSKPTKVIKSASITKASFAKINGKKLNLKRNYKVYVAAYKKVNGKRVRLGKTIIAHVVGKQKKGYTNAKGIKLAKSSYTLTIGRTAKIKAKTILVDRKKKQLSDAHTQEFRYRSTDTGVATVSAKGKITAKGKGTCTIYVYARNGYAKKVKVTVK